MCAATAQLRSTFPFGYTQPNSRSKQGRIYLCEGPRASEVAGAHAGGTMEPGGVKRTRGRRVRFMPPLLLVEALNRREGPLGHSPSGPYLNPAVAQNLKTIFSIL
jgi:hypothetical protein